MALNFYLSSEESDSFEDTVNSTGSNSKNHETISNLDMFDNPAKGKSDINENVSTFLHTNSRLNSESKGSRLSNSALYKCNETVSMKPSSSQSDTQSGFETSSEGSSSSCSNGFMLTDFNARKDINYPENKSYSDIESSNSELFLSSKGSENVEDCKISGELNEEIALPLKCGLYEPFSNSYNKGAETKESNDLCTFKNNNKEFDDKTTTEDKSNLQCLECSALNTLEETKILNIDLEPSKPFECDPNYQLCSVENNNLDVSRDEENNEDSITSSTSIETFDNNSNDDQLIPQKSDVIPSINYTCSYSYALNTSQEESTAESMRTSVKENVLFWDNIASGDSINIQNTQISHISRSPLLKEDIHFTVDIPEESCEQENILLNDFDSKRVNLSKTEFNPQENTTNKLCVISDVYKIEMNEIYDSENLEVISNTNDSLEPPNINITPVPCRNNDITVVKSDESGNVNTNGIIESTSCEIIAEFEENDNICNLEKEKQAAVSNIYQDSTSMANLISSEIHTDCPGFYHEVKDGDTPVNDFVITQENDSETITRPNNKYISTVDEQENKYLRESNENTAVTEDGSNPSYSEVDEQTANNTPLYSLREGRTSSESNLISQVLDTLSKDNWDKAINSSSISLSSSSSNNILNKSNSEISIKADSQNSNHVQSISDLTPLEQQNIHLNIKNFEKYVENTSNESDVIEEPNTESIPTLSNTVSNCSISIDKNDVENAIFNDLKVCSSSGSWEKSKEGTNPESGGTLSLSVSNSSIQGESNESGGIDVEFQNQANECFEEEKRRENLALRLSKLHKDIEDLRKQLAEETESNKVEAAELAAERKRLVEASALELTMSTAGYPALPHANSSLGWNQANLVWEQIRAKRMVAAMEFKATLLQVEAECSAELSNLENVMEMLEPLNRMASCWESKPRYNGDYFSSSWMRRDFCMEVTRSMNVSSKKNDLQCAQEIEKEISIP